MLDSPLCYCLLLTVCLLVASAMSQDSLESVNNRAKAVKCRNPVGSLGKEILSGCTRKVCTKIGKRGVWRGSFASDVCCSYQREGFEIGQEISVFTTNGLKVVMSCVDKEGVAMIEMNLGMTKTRYNTSLGDCDAVLSDTSEIKVDTMEIKSMLDLLLNNTGATSCPSGWSLFKGNCYRLYGSPVKWSEAQSACQEENANLAVIRDAGVENFVGSLVHTQLGFFSFFAFVGGFQQNPTVEKWSWVDGSPWTYEHWFPGEPNNLLNDENEDCLTMSKFGNSDFGYFNDFPCEWTAPYVCEKML